MIWPQGLPSAFQQFFSYAHGIRVLANSAERTRDRITYLVQDCGLTAETLIHVLCGAPQQRAQLHIGVGLHLGRDLKLGVGHAQQILLQKLIDGPGDGRLFIRLLVRYLGLLTLSLGLGAFVDSYLQRIGSPPFFVPNQEAGHGQGRGRQQ